jgi:hypothetical protein
MVANKLVGRGSSFVSDCLINLTWAYYLEWALSTAMFAERKCHGRINVLLGNEIISAHNFI